MCHWINKLPLSVQRIFLLVVFHFVLAESVSNELLPKTGGGCPGDVLIYNCTVVGSRNTIWSGSAFDCETKMNEIILRHSQFSLSGSSGTCSGGTISARSLGVVDGIFFSQLNVTLNSDMNNKTIQCAHSSDTIVSVGMVTLFVASVPDVPSPIIIPQYSWNDGQSLLTAIIVRVERNVTSFRISDTISGFVTNYSANLFYSGNNSVMPNVTATDSCVGAICELTVDVPSTVCSTSSEVDIIITAANKLGLGPPSEPTTIECNNEFVKVEYNPSTRIVSCIFENELDTSQKLCRFEYGTCDHETFPQNATANGSSSTLVIELTPSATSSIECYVVTASNATYKVMVKGKVETQTDASNLGVIIGSVIGGIVLLLLLATVIVIVIIVVLKCDRTAKEDITDSEGFVMKDRDGKVEEPPSKPMTDAQIKKLINNEYDVVDDKVEEPMTGAQIKKLIKEEYDVLEIQDAATENV